jgi:hypothetical protein
MIGWVWWAACQREPARELPRLLYVSEEGALVADDPAGEARVLVASGVERVAWAPSGRRASFVGPGEIGVVDLVGGGTTRLADGDADTRFGQYGWAFSPDEGSLLYSVQPDPGGVGHRVVDLSTGLTVALPPGALSSIYNWVDDEHLHDWYQVCPANGGACSPFPCASGMSQAVGPDEVACAIEDRLTTYSLPGLRPLGSARLEVSAGSEGPHRLEWSPDGATLAWLTADAVWFADRDAAVMTRVEVDWPVDHFGPTPVDLASWSPDGKWLLCSGIHEVFVLGVDGTEVASWTWWDGKGPPWPSLSSLSFGWSADGAWAWWLRTDDTAGLAGSRARARLARSPLGSRARTGTPWRARDSRRPTHRPVLPLPVMPTHTAWRVSSAGSRAAGRPAGFREAGSRAWPRVNMGPPGLKSGFEGGWRELEGG